MKNQHKVNKPYFYGLLILLIGLLFSSCSPVTKSALTRQFKALETKLQDHTGFMLYDLENKKELYSFQADRYFTPASNTKIFTLYTGLVVLGDSIPALKYVVRGDSLIFSGTGDPSFLYDAVHQSNRVVDFLKDSSKQIFLARQTFFTEPLGPGWSWDDYSFSYSAERSAFPMYGNCVTIQHQGNVLKVSPQVFSFDFSVADSMSQTTITRDIGSNRFMFHPGNGSRQDWTIPFKTSDDMTAKLLSDTLNKSVTVLDFDFPDSTRILYSTPVDSLFKVMMQESDNFIAEQLLLASAAVLSDSLKPEIAISFMKKYHLNDLPDAAVWVDGSGLSRYNLFTPRSIVKLWDKIYAKVQRERLFPLLAIGGKAGTIRNWYANDPPYIYGKTGSLSNNHSLSGYLVTKSGRTMIFSFMSNNYVASAGTLRKEMEKILRNIYLHY